MSRTSNEAVPPDFLWVCRGTYDITLTHAITPTRLGGWLGRVVVCTYYSVVLDFIATLTSIWYDSKILGD